MLGRLAGSWLLLEVSMTVPVLGRQFADCAETTIVIFRIVKLPTDFVSEVRSVNGFRTWLLLQVRILLHCWPVGNVRCLSIEPRSVPELPKNNALCQIKMLLPIRLVHFRAVFEIAVLFRTNLHTAKDATCLYVNIRAVYPFLFSGVCRFAWFWCPDMAEGA